MWRRLAAVVPRQTDRQTDTAQGIVDDGQDIITESVWTTRMSCQVNSSRAEFFFIFYIIQCTLAAQSSCPVSDCLIHSRIGIICYLLAWETRNRNETQQLNRKIDGLFIQCGYTIVCNPPPLRWLTDGLTDWPGWDGMALVLNSNHIPIDDTTTDYDSFSIVPMKSGW